MSDGDQIIRDINVTNPYEFAHECSVHTDNLHEGCEGCETEFESKSAVNKKMGKAVEGALNALAKHGMGPSVETINAIRLEVLIEAMLHGRNRVHFETEVGRRLLIQATDVLQKASSQALVKPNGSGGLIVPR